MIRDEKVSIIVPIYKVENYLDRCINSLVLQTYRNIEIILVDDGSPDNCGEICDNYAKRDSRIKVIHKKNGGLSDARNAGFEASTGDIIAYVDSDDWISKNMIFETVQVMQQQEADIVAFGFYKTDGYKLNTIYNSESISIYDKEEALLKLCQNKQVQSHAWDKIYRKRVLVNNPFPIGKLYEDVFVMHKIFERANKIVFVDKPFYYYFQREGSILTINSAKAFYDYIEGCEQRIQDLQDKSKIICSLTRAAYLKAILDVLRIISKQNSDTFVGEYADLSKKVQTWDNYTGETKYLGRNLRIEYYMVKWFPKMYRKYRYYIEILKKSISGVSIKKRLRKIKRFFEKYREFKAGTPLKINKGKADKRIILLGSPEYNNLGDHAIAYATKKFVEKYFPTYQFIEVPENAIDFSLPMLKKAIKNTDLLLLQGGGNLGDLYEDQQRIRRKAIFTFHENKIVLMPQTCHFSESNAGKIELDKTEALFRSHSDLTLFAREEYSFNVMKDAFQNAVYLTPDIVLSLHLSIPPKKREGVAVCLRSDREGAIDIAAKQWIVELCKGLFHDVTQIDTCTNEKIAINKREEKLMNFWENLSGKKLLITDRLHGMIFAAITNTPCVVLSNSNYKIKGVYQWIKNIPWIRFCNNPYGVEDYINRVLESELCDIDLSDKYSSLIEMMRESK